MEAAPGTGRHEEGLSRIEGFTDGVVAIAITLLILQLAVPGPRVSGRGLARALMEQESHFFAYLLSFAVIGRFWIAHHGLFRYVRRYDRRFLELNLVFLLTIAFLPFSSDLLGEHGGEVLAVAIYAVSVAAASLASGSLWIYATSGRRLVDPAVSEAELRHLRRRALAGGPVFLLSIPLAFVAVWLAFVVWLGLLPAVRLGLETLHRRDRREPSPR